MGQPPKTCAVVGTFSSFSMTVLIAVPPIKGAALRANSLACGMLRRFWPRWNHVLVIVADVPTSMRFAAGYSSS
jgi:hypothetical protein